MSDHDEETGCRIDRLPSVPALEFTAFAWPAQALGEPAWPGAPGAVRYDSQGRALLLHFAPGRWLAPDPIDETRSLLASAAGAGLGAVVEVTGKWDTVLILGPGATRLMACAIGIEAVLDARDCAALTLFDCPVTVARYPEGFALWLQSSYTTDFLTTAEHFRTSLACPP